MGYINLPVVLVIVILLALYLARKCYVSAYGTRVYWFYLPDCAWCDKMKSDWDMFARSAPSLVVPIKINKDENKELADNFGVTSVPHIVKVRADIRVVYEGDRSSADLMNWASK